MKKTILIIIACLFSFSAYAQLSEAYETTKEKVKSFVSEKKEACPVYADTPMSKVERAPWEIEIGLNFLYDPSNGDSQFRTDSWSGEIVHNFSSAFGAFVKYDTIAFEKRNYDGSKYSKEWSGYSVAGGFHLYLTPIVRIYGAAGKIQLKDSNGNEPDYGTTFEKGIKIDIPLKDWGYKLVIAYRIVDASIASDNPDIQEALADGSYNSLTLTLSLPFGYPD